MPSQQKTNESKNTTVAFLEDDLEFSQYIENQLKYFNYDVTHFSHGRQCMSMLVVKDFDICLFDYHLPDISGLDVLERLKKIKRLPPVIFMTGNDSEDEVTRVLMAGADDYIVKPTGIAVLNARMQSLLRRSKSKELPVHKEKLGNLIIDYTNKVILRNGQPVALTGTETILAFDFFMHRGQIVTRNHLYELLGVDALAFDTRRLDVHISHLRSKLFLNSQNGWKLTSVYQRGYRLEYLHEIL